MAMGEQRRFSHLSMAGRVMFRQPRTWLNLSGLAEIVERWIARHFVMAFAVMILVVLSNELLLFGPDLRAWDPLYISTALTFILGIRLALSLGPRMNMTLSRLARRGAVLMAEQEVASATDDLEARAQAWAERAGLLIALVMLAAFLAAFGRGVLGRAWFTLVSAGGGYLAGRAVGRAVAYGTLGSFLRKRGHSILPEPQHVDGAAGLKPVGDFYFFQAMVLAIPAVFLAAWSVVIPFIGRYTYWRGPYLGLLAVAMTSEILAFIVPLYSFHRVMKEYKSRQLPVADELSRNVSNLQSQLAGTTTKSQREALQERLSSMLERYEAIEGMPTWPVDKPTRRRFTRNNLGIVLPLVSKALSLTAPWREIADALQQIFSA
jgi:hypothetical protein